jgi:tRNA dimethylallyltransferase
MSQPPLIALAGPTASGKSSLALALCAAQGGELVSCDSVQVYRGFEIGCAKPTAAERARVPHHLLDVAAWDEPFDAQRYRELAVAALADVRARGRLPVLCGGTGLYLRTLRWGLVEVPPGSPALRAELYAEEERQPGAAWRRLSELDPESARSIERNNLVYVVRALEITLQSGEPASAVRARHGFEREVVPMRVVAVDWPAVVLRERIVTRVTAMLAAGLLDEVAGLLASGVRPECRPMRSLGYKECAEVVRNEAPRAGLEERIVSATVAYARRQRTWLRRERGVRWLESPRPEHAVSELVRVASES